MTTEQYLAQERKAETKSEYVDGLVYAMAGAGLAHVQIALNIGAALRALLRNSTCRPLAMDMRVRVPDSRLYAYPDVVIACGELELEDDELDTLLNPVVIFEVLSPSTEAWDRGRKFKRYATIPSLIEYVLVSQSDARVERFVREGEDWRLSIFEGLEAKLQLESVGIELPLSEIYDRVEFEEESRPTGGVR